MEGRKITQHPAANGALLNVFMLAVRSLRCYSSWRAVANQLAAYTRKGGSFTSGHPDEGLSIRACGDRLQCMIKSSFALKQDAGIFRLKVYFVEATFWLQVIFFVLHQLCGEEMLQ